MTRVFLSITSASYQEVWAHLLPRHTECEEAGFMYVKQVPGNAADIFEYVGWYPIPPSGFVSRSRCNLELADETRARAIKHAHDLGTSLVEFHSHRTSLPAAFSPSDFMGFQEFVPHVWWRLKQRPYLAVVVTQTGFDGLVWLANPQDSQRLDGIVIEGLLLSSASASEELDQ